jgi:hypothetical protein
MMADILVRGGETEVAANELAATIRDLFGVDPIATPIAASHAPGTRVVLELAAIALALPPALLGTADILSRSRLGDRMRRLIAKAASLRKTTRATIFIDPGDGKPIPLEEASRDAILAALHAVEQRLKS